MPYRLVANLSESMPVGPLPRIFRQNTVNPTVLGQVRDVQSEFPPTDQRDVRPNYCSILVPCWSWKFPRPKPKSINLVQTEINTPEGSRRVISTPKQFLYSKTFPIFLKTFFEVLNVLFHSKTYEVSRTPKPTSLFFFPQEPAKIDAFGVWSWKFERLEIRYIFKQRPCL